ncbi:MAG: FtsW/RodA/SpoVE family cell cycle protein [Candidatus Amulumruptor caecigallinarius]|nr:FtsW/RodA/SpoVE family cell cycle protein [Candidatus Amulumruptor caecigallinarius]MCM1396476.1 FtsW/RodA/SpoVE family cell cycle protein [Candidatus Amulumruptor caecigallinarius]MCM1453467.1 FtsW/RodA/SpoVE family cell cycle protein [bacterium]
MNTDNFDTAAGGAAALPAGAIPATGKRTAAVDAELAPVAKPDPYIWGVYIFLVLVSIVELYSASSREVVTSGMLGVFAPVVRHVGTLLLGLVCILFLQRTHYSKLIKPITIFAILAGLLMLYVMFFGEKVNGARRSVTFFITIQPSEMIKLAAPLMIALILSRTQNRRNSELRTPGVWVSVIVVTIYCGLLVTQGMTNTLLLISISVAMLIIGGSRWATLGKITLFYIALGIVLGAAAVLFVKPDEKDAKADEKARADVKTLVEQGKVSPVQLFLLERFGDKGRVGTWVMRSIRHSGNPDVPKYEQEIADDNAQEMYAYMAQAHGGLIGVGPGNSRETSRLPLAFSDYIYSIIIEETGLIGGMFVLGAYLLLLGRASSIASQCSRAFPALLVIGMAVTVVCQALFHMAIVVGVFPVSGQPLPLISKGGCSILMVSVAFGVMLSVSRFAVRGSDKKATIRREIAALPEELRGDNLTMID